MKKVPVGLASKAGYSLTAAALAAAVVAYLTGDRSEQTLGTLSAAGVAILAFVITQAGRYLQAYAIVKPAPVTATQAITKLGKALSDPTAGAATDSAVSGPALGFGTMAGSERPIEERDPDEIADDDGPGDLFDMLPHWPVSDPESIKPDHVDDRDTHPDGGQEIATRSLLAHATSHHSVTYRLSNKHRREVDAVIRRGIDALLRNPGSVHYTQDYRARWSAIREGLRIIRGQYLTHGDCSSTDTWLLKNGLFRAGFHPDVVNGQGWAAGYTGTMINHGRRVVHDENLRFGDQIFYGDQGGGVPEHVATYIGGGLVFSHGSEGGPYKLPLDYRPDRRRGEARRYY